MNLKPAAIAAAVCALALPLAACGAGDEGSPPDTAPTSATPPGGGAGGEGATPSGAPAPDGAGDGDGVTPSEGGGSSTPAGASTPDTLAGGGGGDTARIMGAMWGDLEDEEKGWTCMLFRAEDDYEERMGEDAVVDGIIEANLDAPLDREGVRSFLDGECPTAEEIDEAAGVE